MCWICHARGYIFLLEFTSSSVWEINNQRSKLHCHRAGVIDGRDKSSECRRGATWTTCPASTSQEVPKGLGERANPSLLCPHPKGKGGDGYFSHSQVGEMLNAGENNAGMGDQEEDLQSSHGKAAWGRVVSSKGDCIPQVSTLFAAPSPPLHCVSKVSDGQKSKAGNHNPWGPSCKED